jgi:hypothetical protein
MGLMTYPGVLGVSEVFSRNFPYKRLQRKDLEISSNTPDAPGQKIRASSR